VTVGDIYSLFPFGNISYRYEVTWEEALRVFEYALTKEGYMLLTKMSGVQCYFTGTAVNALIYHGKPVYVNGTWYDGMEKENVRIGVSLFLATSKRPTETGLLNPLYVWKKEGRAEVFETPDNEAAAAALKKIAAENDGHIPVDHTSWFVEGEYPLPDSQS
jgi:2',3'-cyclic-nucleotide 2'-phosphodiesterase (5'-nucleotidase family)